MAQVVKYRLFQGSPGVRALLVTKRPGHLLVGANVVAMPIGAAGGSRHRSVAMPTAKDAGQQIQAGIGAPTLATGW